MNQFPTMRGRPYHRGGSRYQQLAVRHLSDRMPGPQLQMVLALLGLHTLIDPHGQDPDALLSLQSTLRQYRCGAPPNVGRPLHRGLLLLTVMTLNPSRRLLHKKASDSRAAHLEIGTMAISRRKLWQYPRDSARRLMRLPDILQLCISRLPRRANQRRRSMYHSVAVRKTPPRPNTLKHQSRSSPKAQWWPQTLVQKLCHTRLLRSVSHVAQQGRHTTSKQVRLHLLLVSTHRSRVNLDDQQQCKDLRLKPLQKQSLSRGMRHPHRRLAARSHKRHLPP